MSIDHIIYLKKIVSEGNIHRCYHRCYTPSTEICYTDSHDRRLIARHVYSLFHSLARSRPAMLSRSANNNMKRVQVVTGRIINC